MLLDVTMTDDDDDDDDDDTCNLSESGESFFPAQSMYHSQKGLRLHPIMKLLTNGNFNSLIVLKFCLSRMTQTNKIFI